MNAMVAGLLGASGWTFTEYVVHRWLGHDAKTRPNFFEIEHTRHHAEGDYFAPSWKKGLVGTAVLAGIAFPATRIVGATTGWAFAAGFAGMYLTYEWVHRRAHTHPGATSYGRWVRHHHFSHHFTDPRRNHGVTSPVWDWVFGTYHRVPVVVVPAKLAMPWLVDPATGDLRPEFASTWKLRGRGSRSTTPGSPAASNPPPAHVSSDAEAGRTCA
jgi:hypothetical protein